MMNFIGVKGLLALASLVTISLLGAAQKTSPDLILFNGKIFTSDASHPYVQALAIQGVRIVATGESEEIRLLAGPRSKQIDLGGRTVVPGINDAHNHLDVAPPDMVELQFKGRNPTWAEAQVVIAAAALKAPKGTFLSGEIATAIFRDVAVERDSLDKLAPDHPVILTTLTGHASILNSAALSRLGIREDQQDPAGGRYERFPDGRLSGVLREYAVLKMNRALAGLTSDADAVVELRDILTQAAKFGITSIQDMTDAMTPDRCVLLLEKMPTPIRIRVIRMPGTSPSGRDAQKGLPLPRNPSPLITVSGTKWLIDGVPLENTFESRGKQTSMADSSHQLLFSTLPETFSQKEMELILRESLQNNDQLMVHVSGYPAARMMLSAMQATGGASVWVNRRVRFEHGDGLLPDLLPQVKEMGIVDVQNPTHFAGASVSPEIAVIVQAEKSQPLKSLLAAGIPLALGSDGPMNPYLNILFASIHPDRPTEAITREQAVIAYTLTSAYAEFAEKEKGSLEPGKLADLAVLSQDIFSIPPPDLPKTESILTLVGGKVVYDAKILTVH